MLPKLANGCDEVTRKLKAEELDETQVTALKNGIKEIYEKEGTSLVEVPTALLTNGSVFLTYNGYLLGGIVGVASITAVAFLTVRWFNDKNDEDNSEKSLKNTKSNSSHNVDNKYEKK